MAQIKIVSDFVCPFCFLGEKTVEETFQPNEIEWIPFELRPEGSVPLDPNSAYVQQSMKQSVLPIAERLGIEIRLPDISPIPRTRLAHIGFYYAKEHGKGNDYFIAVFKAYWQQGRDISQSGVLAQVAEHIGLDTQAFLSALQDERYAKLHEEGLRQTDSVRAVPTFFVGDRVLQGIQSKESLELARDEDARKVASDPDASGAASCSIDGCGC
ncbi:DsbA family oxidoreductase [Paenibacillus apiarius]|uniref:DsbA family oxidoreductase n=1 Tax=Paenibacillus apiarius TaxID=46240 RepID=UPI00197E5FD6|nr:DsbA family protein [Paenibacillus apiarius]MBN3525470.1 DsbA family protein [Paenibacillus apiarius]